MNSSQTKPDIYEQITNGIIAAIEAGAATYEMPWRTLSTPINASTRKPYRGVNTLCLWCLARKHHDSSQEWVTYRQWSELGAQVRRGERSATVVFSKFFDGSERSDAGDEMDPFGRLIHAPQIPLLRPRLSRVQCRPGRRLHTNGHTHAARIRAHRECRTLLPVSARRRQHGGARAFYSPETDEIHVPAFEQFKSAASYYSVLGHEYVHFSGAPSHLHRDLTGRLGDARYSMEELIAELGSAFLCADLQLESEPRRDHAGYIQSWLSVLKSDKRALFTAASQAQQAIAYLHRLAANRRNAKTGKAA